MEIVPISSFSLSIGTTMIDARASEVVDCGDPWIAFAVGHRRIQVVDVHNLLRPHNVSVSRCGMGDGSRCAGSFLRMQAVRYSAQPFGIRSPS